ncbi:ATP-binding protein [Celeribacter indicus]|uniref:histidine kinase n=1 Tax=Celeribacter indicus TaxID=1208324 RepID=A0A0B5E5U2_9RHOB|nr:ATP-binding protein [Celeribacter indicus]AJE48386.1 Putative sensor protein [Celeribacter indicus]SDW74597.1 PAS domain S-box-containing protein [Celeribacter indicus]
MPDRNYLTRTHTLIEYIVYAVIIGFFFILGATLERVAHLRAGEEQTVSVLRTQSILAERIQESLNKKFLFARGLAGAIALSPDLSESEFSRLAEGIRTEDPAVINMALVRNNIVTHVFPYDQNREFLGRDLSGLPRQMEVLSNITETGRTILEGPGILLQGYEGFVIREPISLAQDEADHEAIYAIASVVFSTERFLDQIEIADFTPRFDIAIRTNSPFTDGDGMIFGNRAAFRQGVEAQVLHLPASRWEIAVAPLAGAIAAPANIPAIRFTILVVCLTMLAISWYLHRLRRDNYRIATRLSTAINAAPSALVMFDAQDRLEICNTRFRELYGADAPQIVQKGVTFEDFLRAGLQKGVYEDAIGNEEEWLRRYLVPPSETGVQFNVEFANGRCQQVIERKTPDGGRVAILNDITEILSSRSRAELAEQRLHDAIDALPVGFWLFDRSDRLVMFNKVAGEKLAGWRRELTLGRDLHELTRRRFEIAEEVRIGEAAVEDPDQAILEIANETSELEVCFAENLWFKYFTRRTSEGGLVVFRVDISDLRQHQQRLEDANQELRAALFERDRAETRFRDVADISSEWFWEQDDSLRITYLSEGFRRTMDLDPSEFIGRFQGNLMDFRGTEAEEFARVFAKMRARETFHDIVVNFSFVPEKETWIKISGKPSYDEDGTFRGYVGTAEDVTPFYTALREAEQADEAKTQFLNVISHELRTPLTAVLGFNSFLANAATLPSYKAVRAALESDDREAVAAAFEAFGGEIQKFSGRIQAAGYQLRALIDDMLDLARIEANTIRLEPGPVDSRAVIRSVADQMSALIDEKGLTLKTDLADVRIRADETRFRQVLTNLLGNACKFTDAGTISISSQVKNDMVVFEVADTGIGIAADHLDLVFDRFAQAESGTKRRNQGVGLGLAICKDLLKLQNGWIRVESEIGQGSRFIFALPLCEGACEEAEAVS